MNRTARFATPVLVLLAFSLLLGPIAAADDAAPGQVRTDPGSVAGYTIVGTGAPMTMLLYEPVIPAPVDPGEPHLEASESYTRVSLSTGPTARALASSFWPGPLFGDGMETITEDQFGYPIKADARYPQGPETDEQELPGVGAGMRGSALGLDVVAESTSKRSPSEEAAGFGNVASLSTATVEDGIAHTSVLSTASDVRLLGGIISIGSVRTTLEATSDGAAGHAAGATEVSGLTIAGSGFTVDEEGPRPVEDDSPGQGSLAVPRALPGAEELREALGIEVELLPHADAGEGADVSRSAGGLRITVDTNVMHAALNQLPLFELVDALPDEMATELYPLLDLSPKIVYILGRASVRAAATEPLDLDLGLPPPPAPAPVSPPADVHSDLAAVADFTAPPAPEAPAPAEPKTAPGLEAPVTAVSEQLPELFGGIPAALVIAAMLLVGLAGRGLAALTPLALGGTAPPCTQGAPQRAPNLRGG
jgi:hypothetical protein